jgi:hypothetical protein
MNVVMYVKNPCTTRTWCYVSIDLLVCIVTKHNSTDFMFTFTKVKRKFNTAVSNKIIKNNC